MVVEQYKWTANYTGSVGAAMISEALKVNTTLTKLNLARGDKEVCV